MWTLIYLKRGEKKENKLKTKLLAFGAKNRDETFSFQSHMISEPNI